MHEWAIVEETIKEVVKHVNRNGIKKVDRIGISIGEDEHLTEDTVRFCFECLSKETIIAKTKLEIKKAAGAGIIIDFIEGTTET